MPIPDLHSFHAPLLAFAVALALAGAARFLRVGILAAAAGGAGVLAGWYAITGVLWVAAPRISIDDLTQIAAAALLIGLVVGRFAEGSAGTVGTLVAALFAAWWLTGAPRHLAGVRAGWPVGLGTALATLLLVRLLMTGAQQLLSAALAGITLAASLYVAGVPSVWLQLALVPALAALAMCLLPPMPGLAVLPVAADIAALSCLVVLAVGRLPRLGIGTIDVAAASPFLALWLVPRVTQRFGFAGRAAPLAAGVLSGAVSVGLTWATRAVLRH
ncbi:MAG TPA: hypothetical protein VKQ27_14780 [Acetobacteraceae bacterium]|nr:hypothetical protein [Acetobacteraceae bacterium]